MSERDDSSGLTDVYVAWMIIGAFKLADDLVKLNKNNPEVNFFYIIQVLSLIVIDTIIGGIGAVVYKIIKSIAEVLGLI